MSVSALTWAFAQEIRPATHKFVLVALADYANEDLEAYPTIGALEKKTCLDRKAIFRSLTDLKERGFIEPTGERKGTTKQTYVYRLKQCPKGNSSQMGRVPILTRKSSQIGTLQAAGNISLNRKEPSVRKISLCRAESKQEVIDYAVNQGMPIEDGSAFWNSMESGGWTRGGKPIKDWKAHFRTWKDYGYLASQKKNLNNNQKPHDQPFRVHI